MEAQQSGLSEAAEQASSGVSGLGVPPEPLLAPSTLGLWTAALQCLKAADTDKAGFSAACQRSLTCMNFTLVHS